MAINRGLGRGFDSLIPTQIIEEEFDPTAKNSAEGRIQQISPNKIVPNEDQPRTYFDEDEIQALADSIREHGVLQPLVAVPKGGQFELIAGERRLRAAKSLNLETVPVIVRTVSQQHKLELALIENIQRQDLNPLETATAYRKLYDQFNLGYEAISKRVGKNQSTVKNMVRLLNLPKSAKQALVEGVISEGHARAILAVKEELRQLELLELIIKNSWTVRRAEEYARESRDDKPKEKKSAATHETEETKRLSDNLKAPVTLQKRAKGGKLVIGYKDDMDLERIIRELAK